MVELELLCSNWLLTFYVPFHGWISLLFAFKLYFKMDWFGLNKILPSTSVSGFTFLILSTNLQICFCIFHLSKFVKTVFISLFSYISCKPEKD